MLDEKWPGAECTGAGAVHVTVARRTISAWSNGTPPREGCDVWPPLEALDEHVLDAEECRSPPISPRRMVLVPPRRDRHVLMEAILERLGNVPAWPTRAWVRSSCHRR